MKTEHEVPKLVVFEKYGIRIKSIGHIFKSFGLGDISRIDG